MFITCSVLRLRQKFVFRAAGFCLQESSCRNVQHYLRYAVLFVLHLCRLQTVEHIPQRVSNNCACVSQTEVSPRGYRVCRCGRADGTPSGWLECLADDDGIRTRPASVLQPDKPRKRRAPADAAEEPALKRARTLLTGRQLRSASHKASDTSIATVAASDKLRRSRSTCKAATVSSCIPPINKKNGTVTSPGLSSSETGDHRQQQDDYGGGNRQQATGEHRQQQVGYDRQQGCDVQRRRLPRREKGVQQVQGQGVAGTFTEVAVACLLSATQH